MNICVREPIREEFRNMLGADSWLSHTKDIEKRKVDSRASGRFSAIIQNHLRIKRQTPKSKVYPSKNGGKKRQEADHDVWRKSLSPAAIEEAVSAGQIPTAERLKDEEGAGKGVAPTRQITNNRKGV